jgi:aarF domain-containing kinase
MAYRFGRVGILVRNATLVRTAGIVSVASLAVSQYRYAQCDVATIQPVKVFETPRVVAISPTIAAPLEEEIEGNWVYRGAKKVGRFLKYLYRFLTITTLASPMTVLGPSAYLLGKHIPALEEIAWGYLVWALNMLGPAFIKLGQWASTRPDLYPPKVIAKLVALQDNVKSAHSMETVENTLTESFGPHWRERLVLDPKPIGAGCIAQVFRGTLIGEDSLVHQSESSASSSIVERKMRNAKDNKRQQVAVKVIHPHVEAMLRTDMELLAMFGSFLDSFASLKNLSLGDSAHQFCKSMTDQIDMKLEATNLIVFRKKWQHEQWASFPAPVAGMVTKNVLVETLMEGNSIANYMSMSDTINGKVDQGIRKLRSKLSDMGARAMIKMIFFDNFIHGDLHPGNILVKMDEKTGEPHMVFLDCGIVFSSKDKKDHETIVEICIAFMQHDGRKAAKLMIDHSQNKADPKEMEGFIEGVHQIVVDCKEHNYFEHIGEYVMRICNLARDYNVKLDPGYFHIAMALKVAEGISLSLDKTLDMISKCLPVVVRAKAYQAMGIEDVSMSQVASDLEKTQKELELQEAKIRAQVKSDKAKADQEIDARAAKKSTGQ